MAIINAKISKGVPGCPECGSYSSDFNNYGVVEKGKGKSQFWFSFKCLACSTKRKKVYVKYFADADFKVVRRA